MKPRYRIAIVVLVVSLIASGCATLTSFLNGSGRTPNTTPTVTKTLSVSLWGQPPPTNTLTPPAPLHTPRPITSTPRLPTATSQPATAAPTSKPTTTPTIEPTPSPAEMESAVTTLLFTGSIVPARCVQKSIDEKGNPDFIFDQVRDLLLEADITIGTLNAALSDYPPHTGWCEKGSFVLVGRSNNADAMARAGFDVMAAATNHIKNCGVPNCGDRAFLDTLDNLDRVDIQVVGAGIDLQEALRPVVVQVNGIRFGFVAFGADYGTNSFAKQDTPGIAMLTEEHITFALEQARQQADVIIALPHWGADYPTGLNPDQIRYSEVFAKQKVDLVVGNHSHTIQGMQERNGTPIFYSLGSFIFDQNWSLETQQGIIVRVTFKGTEMAWYDIIPVHIYNDGHVEVAEELEAAAILERFQDLTEALK